MSARQHADIAGILRTLTALIPAQRGRRGARIDGRRCRSRVNMRSLARPRASRPRALLSDTEGPSQPAAEDAQRCGASGNMGGESDVATIVHRSVSESWLVLVNGDAALRRRAPRCWLPIDREISVRHGYTTNSGIALRQAWRPRRIGATLIDGGVAAMGRSSDAFHHGCAADHTSLGDSKSCLAEPSPPPARNGRAVAHTATTSAATCRDGDSAARTAASRPPLWSAPTARLAAAMG